MTPAEIRAAMTGAADDMVCVCYDLRSCEYGPNYPCSKCRLRQAEIDLGALLAADCDRMVTR